MAMPVSRINGDWTRSALMVVRVLVSVVLGFWVWFAGMHLFGNEPGNGLASLWPVLGLVSICLALGAAAWLWARVGGAALVGAAVASTWFFHHPATLVLMGAPLAVCGVALLLLAPGRGTREKTSGN